MHESEKLIQVGKNLVCPPCEALLGRGGYPPTEAIREARVVVARSTERRQERGYGFVSFAEHREKN